MVSYQEVKNVILGHKWDVDNTGDFDCVDVSKKADSLYHPGTTWMQTGIHGNGKDIFNNANPKYYQKIANDHNNPNQLPQPGDIMCFDATPKTGYTNSYHNPYGHTGICDSATSNGYNLLQQSSGTGKAAWIGYNAWKYRPCIGWLRPIGQNANITLDQLKQVYADLLHRAPDQAGIDHYVGHYSRDFVVADIKKSNEYAIVNAPKPAPAPTPVNPYIQTISDLTGQVNDLKSRLSTATAENADLKKTVIDQTARIGELGNIITNLQNQVTTLKAQAGEATKWQTLGALLRELLGLNK